MTISLGELGAFNSGTTSAALTQPTTSLAKGNLYLALIGSKPFASTSIPTPPNSGTAYDMLASGTSGSVANGVSTGSVRASAFRHHCDATETGSITFSVASGSPTMGRISRWTKTADVWDLAATILSDTDETGTTVSATGSSISIASGDKLVFGVVIKDDAVTHTSQAVSVPGCTLGTITWQAEDTTISGNDGAMYFGHCDVTAGSSSGAPTYTATSSVSGASSTAVSVVRLREVIFTAEPLVRSCAAGGAGGTTTLTSHVARIPPCNVGDRLVVSFTLNSGHGTVTEPGGSWVRNYPTTISDDGLMTMLVYEKATADSTDAAGGATVTVTTATAVRSDWGSAALMNADAANVSSSASGTGSPASVSLNSTVANTRVLAIGSIDSSSEDASPNAQLTELYDPAPSLNGQVNWGGTAAKAATGSVSYGFTFVTGGLSWKIWAAAWPAQAARPVQSRRVKAGRWFPTRARFGR